MTHRRVLRRSSACRRAVALASGLTIGVLLLTSCGSGVQGGGGGTQFVGGSGEITLVAAADRKQAPDISGTSVDGEELKLSDYRGDIVVLNVWGSWCAPCRAEAPNLAKVAKDTADQGVQFLGINTRDHDQANAKSFDRSFGITYPSFFDPSGKLILRFPKDSLSPQLIPSTVVIDREGRIAVRALKALSEEDLRDMLDPLLKDTKPAGATGDPDSAEKPDPAEKAEKAENPEKPANAAGK